MDPARDNGFDLRRDARHVGYGRQQRDLWFDLGGQLIKTGHHPYADSFAEAAHVAEVFPDPCGIDVHSRDDPELLVSFQKTGRQHLTQRAESDLHDPSSGHARVSPSLPDTHINTAVPQCRTVSRDKPPLMFWLINAGSGLTGGRITPVSARLPSWIGAVLSLWVVTRLLARWCNAASAWRATAVLLTTFLFWQEGGFGRIDGLLCGLVLMSVYFFFTQEAGSRAWRLVGAYGFAGLAALAKGPVGLALPLGIYAGGVSAVDRFPAGLSSRSDADCRRVGKHPTAL